MIARLVRFSRCPSRTSLPPRPLSVPGVLEVGAGIDTMGGYQQVLHIRRPSHER